MQMFFSKQCSQNRWNLYLQKLLADSTESFLFWRIYFWLREKPQQKLQKIEKF